MKRNPTPKLNKEKARQTILYLLNKLGALDEKKLQLLLYYIDFDYYEKYEKQFIGLPTLREYEEEL